MLAEFERHTDIACTSLDLAANRAEAARHVVAMDRWADLTMARASGLGTVTEPKEAPLRPLLGRRADVHALTGVGLKSPERR